MIKIIFMKNFKKLMVGLDGLGPSTFALSEQRSNHLSYRPFLSKIIIISFLKVNCYFFNMRYCDLNSLLLNFLY